MVRRIETLGGGELFIKTHPNSKRVWADHPLHSDEKIRTSICTFEKDKPEKKPDCFQVADRAGSSTLNIIKLVTRYGFQCGIRPVR